MTDCKSLITPGLPPNVTRTLIAKCEEANRKVERQEEAEEAKEAQKQSIQDADQVVTALQSEIDSRKDNLTAPGEEDKADKNGFSVYAKIGIGLLVLVLIYILIRKML